MQDTMWDVGWFTSSLAQVVYVIQETILSKSV